MSAEENLPESRARLLRVPRWILFIAGLLAIILVGGFVAAKLLFPPERLRALVVPRIEARVGRDVELSAIRLRLLPRVAVRLENLSISSPPQFGERPALSVEALDLQVRVLPYLLRREVELDRLRLLRPQIHYEVLSDGTSNFTGMGADRGEVVDPAETADPGGAMAAGVVVSDLRLQDGTLVYVDQRSGRAARMGVEARVSADRDPEVPGALQSRGKIELRSIRALVPNLGPDSLSMPDLEIDFGVLADLAGDSAVLRELDVLAGGLPLSGGGALRGLRGDRVIDFNLESGDVEIARILESLPAALRREDLQASGLARLSLRANGRMSGGMKPGIAGTIRLENLTASNPELGSLLSSGSGVASFDTASLSLPDFTADFLGRPFKLRLTVSDFSNPAMEGHATGGVALAQLAQLRGEPMPAEGDIAFDVDFAGPARELAQLRISGPIELRNVSYQSESLAVPARVSAATVRLTGAGVVAEGVPVKLGRGDLTLSMSSPDILILALARGETAVVPTIQFAIRSRLLDASELSADTGVGYGSLLAAQLAGRQVDGRDPGEIARERYELPPLPPLRVSGRVEIAELVNPPTRGENISFNVELAAGVLEIKDLAGRLYDGELSGGFSVDLSDPAPPYPARYDVRLTSARAGAFLERWTRLGRAVTGTLDFIVRGNAPLEEGLLPAADAIEATGKSTLSEGRFEEFPLVSGLVNKLKMGSGALAGFQQLGGGFEIRDGAFVLDDWGYAGTDVSAQITGSAGLDGRLDLKVDMEVPPQLLQQAGLLETGGLLGDALRELAGEDQAIQLAVGVGGTMSNPDFQVDTEALQAELEKRLEGKGQDLLRRLIKPPK